MSEPVCCNKEERWHTLYINDAVWKKLLYLKTLWDMPTFNNTLLELLSGRRFN